jgi:hypothetical protein
MAELSTYWQVRTLMAEALGAVNDTMIAGHRNFTLAWSIRASLHSALKRIDSTMPDLMWPGLAAPA